MKHPSKMSFAEFVAYEDEKRVNHFVRFCKSTDTPPTTEAAMEIFGFKASDVKPIVEEAIKRLAA